MLQLPDFKAAAKMFISPDGHSVRYLVLTKLDPFSVAAMDQVNAISDAAKGAQPNTSLADASISMGGYPAALSDTRDYYQMDIRFIIAVTIIVVLLTLMLLLRSVIAPLYLVGGSVVISFFAALGIGVLVFQYGFGQQLHWTVPPLASWCWSRWGGRTTTCSSRPDCATSLRTARGTASSGRCHRRAV